MSKTFFYYYKASSRRNPNFQNLQSYMQLFIKFSNTSPFACFTRYRYRLLSATTTVITIAAPLRRCTALQPCCTDALHRLPHCLSDVLLFSDWRRPCACYENQLRRCAVVCSFARESPELYFCILSFAFFPYALFGTTRTLLPVQLLCATFIRRARSSHATNDVTLVENSNCANKVLAHSTTPTLLQCEPISCETTLVTRDHSLCARSMIHVKLSAEAYP